jgi:hypothetical protein
MCDFAFGKICQKISGIFGKNHLHPCLLQFIASEAKKITVDDKNSPVD